LSFLVGLDNFNAPLFPPFQDLPPFVLTLFSVTLITDPYCPLGKRW
jgi:hypothetical protein